MDDDDMVRLQTTIQRNPEAAPIEQGTGGLRKIRLARPNEGKSGGYRVGYAYYAVINEVVLLILFAKNRQASLTQRQKAAVKVRLAAIEAEIAKHQQ